ncbi:MAG TPA: glycosyltransferase [Blastocatellia bacterium]|nr:glycosyltransferase [Blastocatellia bacterium]
MNESEAVIRISLVIPVRNEEESLPVLIDSIRRQTLTPDEVILVDGGSNDRTVQVARELTGSDKRFRLIEAGPATPGLGRNVGIAAASCDWIALTDAGIHLEPDWLERLVEVVNNDPSVEVVYGAYEVSAETFWQRCGMLAYTHFKQERPGGKMRGPFIASSLLRRSVWMSVGGFPDLRATEDLIFMERVQESRIKTGWAPRAIVWWHPPPTIGATFQRFAVYSRCNALAGRQRYWHHGLARQYTLAALFVALALAHSLLWLIFLLLGGAARVGRAVWLRREGRGILWLINPVRFLGVALIIAVIDAATFTGWAQAVWHLYQKQNSASYAKQAEGDK